MRRCFGVKSCARFFAGAEIVFIQRFRIVKAARLDGLGQAAMNLSPLSFGQELPQRFADAIVMKFDRVSRAATANKLRRAHGVQHLQIFAIKPGRAESYILIYRPPRDCECVEELARSSR